MAELIVGSQLMGRQVGGGVEDIAHLCSGIMGPCRRAARRPQYAVVLTRGGIACADGEVYQQFGVPGQQDLVTGP